jgi:hypothetical protein
MSNKPKDTKAGKNPKNLEGAVDASKSGENSPQATGQPEGEVQPPAETPAPEGQAAPAADAPAQDTPPESTDDSNEGANLVDLSNEPSSDEGVAIPAPSESQCAEFAKALANSPEHYEAFKKTLAAADAIIAERARGPRKTLAELETDNYNRLVAKYGKDFVTAKKGTNSGYYSRKTWNAMKNKRGWVEVTKTMPEVQ